VVVVTPPIDSSVCQKPRRQAVFPWPPGLDTIQVGESPPAAGCAMWLDYLTDSESDS